MAEYNPALNFDRVKRNVQKMIAAQAPVSDIDGYLKTEGLTTDQFKAGLTPPSPPPPEQQQAEYLRSQPDLSGAPLRSEEMLTQGRDYIREVPNTLLDQARGMLGNYLDTAMLGGADEVLAALHALPRLMPGGQTFSGAFESELARLEQQRRDYNAVNKGQGQVATGAGVVLNPLNVMGGELIAAAPTAVGRAARAAGIGAVAGGTAGGLGTEGGLGNRALGAAVGGTAGAALGGAAQPGAELLGFGARKGVETGRAILNTLRNQAQAKADPVEQANQLVARALIQDRAYSFPMRPALPGEGNVNMAGENLVGLGRQATVAPGEGRTIAREFFDEQMAGATDRGADAIKTLSNRGYYGTVEALDAQKKATASPLYDKAFAGNKNVASPVIDRILATPAGRQALGEAATMMQNDMSLMGVPDSELTALVNELVSLGKMEAPNTGKGVASGLKLQSLDYVKRALDDQYDKLVRAGEKTKAGIILSLKKSLVAELDRIDLASTGGAYSQARQAWAGPSHALEQVEKGRDLYKLRGKPTDAVRGFIAMSPEDQDLVRIGFVRDAVEDLGTLGDNSSVYLKLFGNENKRAVAQMLFPDEASFNRFAAQMRAEKKMLEANRTVMGGSPTSRIDADKAAMADAENNLGMIDALRSGSIMRLIGEVAQRGRNFQQGLTPEVAAAVARALFTNEIRALSGAQNVRVPAPLAALPGGWLRGTPLVPFIGQGTGLSGAAIATPEPVRVR